MTTNNTHTQQQQLQQISMTEWEGSIKAAAANDILSQIGHMSSATGCNKLWTAYPCMQATRGVLKGGNPWLTLAPSSSRVVTTWRFVVPLTQANTSGVNSSWCSFSSWNKDTKIQGYKDTRIQGCKDMSVPVTLKHAQEFVLVTCHSYTSLTIRQNITVRNNGHN